MAVKRVVTVRAENGASVPPPLELWEKMLGMEWRFSGVSTGHTNGVKPPLFYHTYQLVEPDKVPLTSEQLQTLEQVKALRGEQHPLRILQRERIRAWFLDTAAPMEERKARLMQLLPLDFVQLASKIEIDGVCLKNRAAASTPAMPPVAAGTHVWHDCKVHGHIRNAGEHSTCLSCEGGLGGCVVCGQWEAELQDVCPGAKA